MADWRRVQQKEQEEQEQEHVINMTLFITSW